MPNTKPSRQEESPVGARLLREARVKRGISQADAARLAGITASMLCLYESGARAPGYYNLLAIMESMDIDPRELFPTDYRAANLNTQKGTKRK